MVWKLQVKGKDDVWKWHDFAKNVTIQITADEEAPDDGDSYYLINVFSVDEAKKGYPHFKRGLNRPTVMGLAKKYRAMKWE